MCKTMYKIGYKTKTYLLKHIFTRELSISRVTVKNERQF